MKEYPVISSIRGKVEKRKKEAFFAKKIEVRDLRGHQHFTVDDLYFDRYARLCGVYATTVYMCMCRRIGKDQSCWPSLDSIAVSLNVSRKSVSRALKVLESYQIIEVDRKKGESNIYTLVDKKKWRKHPKVAYIKEFIEEKVDAMTFVHNEA